MTNGLLIYGEKFAHFLINLETLPHIWLCTRSHLNFLIYEENLVFLFNSVLLRVLFYSIQEYTDKKENQSFLIYKEMQSGAVAKSYWLTASSYMGKYLRISSYIRKPFLIYDFATAPLYISLYMRKLWFSFLSVYTSWLMNRTLLLYSMYSISCWSSWEGCIVWWTA